MEKGTQGAEVDYSPGGITHIEALDKPLPRRRTDRTISEMLAAVDADEGPTRAKAVEAPAIPPVAEDAVNPAHYRKHPSGIECIEIVRHMNFNVGNSIKYLWRYMDKGDPIENLKKAQWYIDDEIRRLQGLR